MAESSAEAKRQIRPKVRKVAKPVVIATPPTKIEKDDNDEVVEEARQRVEAWMGLRHSEGDAMGSLKTDSTMKISSAKMETKQELKGEGSSSATNTSEVTEPGSKGTKSILKSPKYTKQVPVEGGDKITPLMTNSLAGEISPAQAATPDIPSEQTSSQNPFICKNVIVERDPTKPMLKRKVKSRPSSESHSAVEGYVPSSVPPAADFSSTETLFDPQVQIVTDSSSQEKPGVQEPRNGVSFAGVPDKSEGSDINEPPIVLNTLEELFAAAGDPLPIQHDRHKVTQDTQLLEADIAFSVMSQDQYKGKLSELKEQHEEERQAQLKVFLGNDKIFGDESDEDDSEENAEEEEDDDMLEMLMERETDETNDDFFDDDDVDVQDTVERQPRAFRLLWETLSEWLTHEAVQYISHLTAEATGGTGVDGPNWKLPSIKRSDIEASRCAGLMAMIKLFLPRSLEELGFPYEIRRTADTRLGELLRTFNYVQEAPKLPVKLWKAMTCIFLEIVLADRRKDRGSDEGDFLELPPSVEAIGMSRDEYCYMTRSAVQTFSLTSSS